MSNVFDMTKKELQAFLVAQGMKKFRADQIFHYIYKQNIFSWNDMVLLPKKDREQLKEVLPIYFPEVVSRLDAPDGQTVKLLLQLADGETVETVLMKHDYGNSICVSSQVGCAVNCAFCASAKNGFVRNLSAGEMVAQLLAFRKYVTPDLHSIVIMGTGEPLLNYDNVIRFMKLIHEKDTLYLAIATWPCRRRASSPRCTTWPRRHAHHPGRIPPCAERCLAAPHHADCREISSRRSPEGGLPLFRRHWPEGHL